MPVFCYSILILASWAASGVLGYFWYKQLEKESKDSQIPELTIFFLLGPVGLCMLLIGTICFGLQKLCHHLCRQ